MQQAKNKTDVVLSYFIAVGSIIERKSMSLWPHLLYSQNTKHYEAIRERSRGILVTGRLTLLGHLKLQYFVASFGLRGIGCRWAHAATCQNITCVQCQTFSPGLLNTGKTMIKRFIVCYRKQAACRTRKE